MMIRLLSLLILLIAAFLLPWWVTLLGVLYYTRWYAGIEVVVGMILVDGYMGMLSTAPYLTLGTLVIVSLGYLMRSWLRTHSHTSL